GPRIPRARGFLARGRSRRHARRRSRAHRRLSAGGARRDAAGVSGFDILRNLRAASRIPVLMLTARGDDVDRIVGLEIGADDYLPKPFNPRELAARIRAILRRARPEETDERAPRKTLSVADIEIDMGTRVVRRDGLAVELTAVEYDLLEKLLRSAGQVIKREELAREVLGRSLSPF